MLLRSKYRDSVYKFRNALSQSHTAVETRLISNNNLGAFYRYVNKRITNTTSIGLIVDQNGVILTGSTLKANTFNCYFVSVGMADNNIVPDCTNVTLVSILDDVDVSATDVMSSIDKLKSNCSSGPDGLPPIVYKQLKQCLSAPLALVYNQLLSVSYVPPGWLVAHIVPVHKKGITSGVANYRPISFTCVAFKILERIVVNRILNHLIHNNILDSAQHGFSKRRSTCTNLLESFNDCLYVFNPSNRLRLFT